MSTVIIPFHQTRVITKNHLLEDNNTFKENNFKDLVMINKRGVTRKKKDVLNISLSNTEAFLLNHSYTINMCNTRQSDMLTQPNFVGCLDIAERRLI